MESPACLRLFASALATMVFFTGMARAQPANPNPNPNRPRQRAEPSWVIPPVDGTNLEHHVFNSPAAGEKVSYLIYLPPGYGKKKSAGTRYPVVYWLHGLGGSQQGIPGFCERLTRAINDGKAPPMLVVFVNGMVDSLYCDAVTLCRPVETVIIQELIPRIDATWRTIPARAGRAIEGFSMGGFGAGHLGFKYPEIFGAVSMLDAAYIDLDATLKKRRVDMFLRAFGGEDEKIIAEHPLTLAEKNTARIKGRAIIRQIAGPLARPNQLLHEKLASLGIGHEYRVFDGAPHNHAVLYERLGDANWAFYNQAFASARAEDAGAAWRDAGKVGGRP
jgi:endo-1,4-beta-xylanase